MKPVICFHLLALAALTTPALPAAEKQPPASAAIEASAPKPLLAGNYVGTWQSNPDSGELRLKLTENGGQWAAEASFTYQGAPIPCTVGLVKVDGAKIEFVLEWNVDGTPGQSRLTGQAEGKTIAGSYDNKTPDGTSTGTWTVTRA